MRKSELGSWLRHLKRLVNEKIYTKDWQTIKVSLSSEEMEIERQAQREGGGSSDG